MKILIFVVAMWSALPGQSVTPAVAGTWTAQFEGRTFVRLEITANGGVKGGITLGNFELDKAGAVRRASDAPRDLKPIFKAEQSGAMVTFSVLDTDDEDRFEFRVIDVGRAELRLLLSDDDRAELAAEGIPAPQPIVLTKQ